MKTENKNFYVTYGGGSRLANCYSRVAAPDYDSAREIIAEKIGDKFAFCYTAEEFEGQPEKYNLTDVPLQPASAYDEDELLPELRKRINEDDDDYSARIRDFANTASFLHRIPRNS